MDSKQLKGLLEKLEELKPSNLSADFQAGIDAAKGVIGDVLDKAFHSERIAKLEAELAELKAKYPAEEAPKPKRRGRKPKNAPTEN